jgi:hypothetical protein
MACHSATTSWKHRDVILTKRIFSKLSQISVSLARNQDAAATVASHLLAVRTLNLMNSIYKHVRE